MGNSVNIRDINPLEHITSDLSKAMHNYEAILNGLVTWNVSDNSVVTVRLATDSDPGFVDYTFPTRKSYANSSSLVVAYDTAYPGCFDVFNRLNLPATSEGTHIYGDIVTLRFTVEESIGYVWQLFEDASIRPESDITVASSAYIYGSYFAYDGNVYIVDRAISRGDSLADCPRQVQSWVSNRSYMKGTIVAESAKAYLLIGSNGIYSPAQSADWKEIGEILNEIPVGGTIEHGKAYLYEDPDTDSAGLFIYTGPTVTKTEDGPVPSFDGGVLDADEDVWYGPVALMPVCEVKNSVVIRHKPTTDIRGFIMRCNASGIGEARVYSTANVALRTVPSDPNKGLGIFSTSNYVLWPTNNAPTWHDGQVYSYGGTDYSAKMVFHHSASTTKSTNIINYDGPDLDRGLCIYLPVIDSLSDNRGNPMEATPKDGATIEFMFRIWPNTALNGRSSADLIVNKAQIYVYSLPRSDDFSGAKVLAKFSMARVTNFYIWAENVAIPNRPVFYKAKFIYSDAQQEWKTYDYYQIPDHVFLAPKGFVDPSLRLYSDDGFYPGMETAGFPLMQDPFGGMDLGRIRLNRIEEDIPVNTETSQSTDTNASAEPGE